jgi:hypothetical protein
MSGAKYRLTDLALSLLPNQGAHINNQSVLIIVTITIGMAPRWLLISHSSQPAVSISKPKKPFFSHAIQGPGLGINISSFGCMYTNKYGAERPIDMAKNINTSAQLSVVKAKATATPTNGAEHGVAKMVVKTPCKKAVKRALWVLGTC